MGVAYEFLKLKQVMLVDFTSGVHFMRYLRINNYQARFLI